MAKKTSRTETPEPLMTLSQVAQYLQVAERTVYLWAQRAQIPSFKLGNVWRFRRTEIEHWIEESRKRTPRTEPE